MAAYSRLYIVERHLFFSNCSIKTSTERRNNLYSVLRMNRRAKYDADPVFTLNMVLIKVKISLTH